MNPHEWIDLALFKEDVSKLYTPLILNVYVLNTIFTILLLEIKHVIINHLVNEPLFNLFIVFRKHRVGTVKVLDPSYIILVR